MYNKPYFSIICVTNNRETLQRWTEASLRRQTCQDYEFIIVDNEDGSYKSAAAALNAGASDATGEYYIFAHQDLGLPYDFLENLKTELLKCANLGVAGIAGVRKTGNGRAEGVNMIHHGPERDPWERGNDIEEPTQVNTVDELMLVIPAKVFASNKFDPEICSGWHLYGVEYSIRMRQEGLAVYVLPLSLWHLSNGGWRGWKHDITLMKIVGCYPNIDYIHTTGGSWPATRRYSLYRAFSSLSRSIIKRVFNQLCLVP